MKRLSVRLQKRFEGTRVTIENFLAWKRGFDEEREKAAKAAADRERAERAGKLTGRQLFMQDQSLNDSDVKFLEAAGETVKVDESLFEDLDDLDLEDEDEDEDPDWKPDD